MVVYATPADLSDWTGEDVLPDDTRLLRDASVVVDTILLGAVYDTDEDELPSDPKIRGILRDATCAQAAWVRETGGGEGPTAFGTLRFDSTAERSTKEVSPSAVYILGVSGLTSSTPGLVR